MKRCYLVGGTALTYDQDGNLLAKGSSLANSWNYDNRLVQTVPGSVTASYSYDPSGQRVRTSDGAVVTRYPTPSYDTDGTTPTKHVAANGVAIATVSGTGASAVPHYVHADHLTGANVVTSASATQEELLDYRPYGAVRIDQKAGAFGERRQFAGLLKDAATGLNYAGQRYYDSSVGRFLSEDSAFLAVGDVKKLQQITKLDQERYLANPQHLNSYSYAFNNPMTNVDATGEFSGRTLGIGALQVGKMVLDIGAVTTTATLSGMAFAGQFPQVAGVLAVGALGNLDNGFVDSSNAFSNIVGSFLDQDPVLATSGPARNATTSLMGDTRVLDGVTLGANIASFMGKELPQAMDTLESAYVIHANAMSAGVGRASNMFMNVKASSVITKVVDNITRVVTGGKSVLDVIESRLSSSDKK